MVPLTIFERTFVKLVALENKQAQQSSHINTLLARPVPTTKPRKGNAHKQSGIATLALTQVRGLKHILSEDLAVRTIPDLAKKITDAETALINSRGGDEASVYSDSALYKSYEKDAYFRNWPLLCGDQVQVRQGKQWYYRIIRASMNVPEWRAKLNEVAGLVQEDGTVKESVEFLSKSVIPILQWVSEQVDALLTRDVEIELEADVVEILRSKDRARLSTLFHQRCNKRLADAALAAEGEENNEPAAARVLEAAQPQPQQQGAQVAESDDTLASEQPQRLRASSGALGALCAAGARKKVRRASKKAGGI